MRARVFQVALAVLASHGAACVRASFVSGPGADGGLRPSDGGRTERGPSSTDGSSRPTDGGTLFEAGGTGPDFRRDLGAPPVGTYYVSLSGSDAWPGSKAQPWRTVGHALAAVPSGGGYLVLVGPGTYEEQLQARRSFGQQVTFRSELPYRAKLTARANPVLDVQGARVTFESFELTGQAAAGTTGLVYFWQADGCTLRDNVIHDSYLNDLVRVLKSQAITLEGNLLYNPADGSQWVDVSGASQDVVLQDNIFMGDYAGSGRAVPANVKSMLAVRTSSTTAAATQRTSVRRNIFVHFDSGTTVEPVISLGGADQPYLEVDDATVENNFVALNGTSVSGAIAIRAARKVTVRANTVLGDAASAPFAGFVGRASASNPKSEAILIANNVYARPDGRMDHLLRSPAAQITSASLRRNLYWNRGKPVPTDPTDLLNYTADPSAVLGDPVSTSLVGAPLPRFEGPGFRGGYATIRDAFVALAGFAALGTGSAAQDAADRTQMPATDLLGRARGTAPDIGAFER